MPYDRIIGRDDAGALIPLEQTSEFFSATGPGIGGARALPSRDMSTKLYVPVASM